MAVDIVERVATMFLLVGLPGSGKTTRATELAGEHQALRLSPDEWMIPLFGHNEAAGSRDVLEGRLIALALDALQRGTSVVLDFGLWSRDERSALRALARSVGATCEIVYLPVDRATQLDRIADRWAQTPHRTFAMSEADVDSWRASFEEPDHAELHGDQLMAPPAPTSSWFDWAADRWPTSTDPT